MSKSPKQAWKFLLADLAKGRRSIECVREFDSLTGDMLAAKKIDFDEFLAAQTVIAAAYAGARALERAGLA